MGEGFEGSKWVEGMGFKDTLLICPEWMQSQLKKLH